MKKQTNCYQIYINAYDVRYCMSKFYFAINASQRKLNKTSKITKLVKSKY